MRRIEKQINDNARIEQIIDKIKVCRLGLTDGYEPYIVPMNFGYKDGVLYFHSAAEGRKIELIKKNPIVCFEMDRLLKMVKAKEACDWGAQYESVMGVGKAQILETLPEKKQGLDIIMAHYSDRSFEYPEKMLKKTAVLKVTITRITGKQS